MGDVITNLGFVAKEYFEAEDETPRLTSLHFSPMAIITGEDERCLSPEELLIRREEEENNLTLSVIRLLGALGFAQKTDSLVKIGKTYLTLGMDGVMERFYALANAKLADSSKAAWIQEKVALAFFVKRMSEHQPMCRSEHFERLLKMGESEKEMDGERFATSLGIALYGIPFEVALRHVS